MFVKEMAVNLANQNSAISMAQPFRNGQEINPRHHRERAKQMAQVMEAEMMQTGFVAHQFQ